VDKKPSSLFHISFPGRCCAWRKWGSGAVLYTCIISTFVLMFLLWLSQYTYGGWGWGLVMIGIPSIIICINQQTT
jgi:hypothetical protein